jgi:Bacteriophage HK97-gp10, putative tail-component
MARVRVERSSQLNEKLRRLRQNTQGPVRAALAKGGDDVVSMARRLAPDGRGEGDNDYKSTIKWRFGADEGGGSDAKTGRSASTSISITAGDKKNPEGPWLEFGTAPFANKGIYSGTVNPGISPQPHFFPSYRANKKAIVKRLNKAIRDAIRGAVK